MTGPSVRTVLVAAPEVRTVVLDDEAVLVHEATGDLHRLDAVGTAIWSCFDGRSPIEEICADLADAFGIDEAVVMADVDTLVTKLRDLGLLVEAPAEARAPSEDTSADPRYLVNPPSP